jgi:hypothetical protein
MANVTFDGPNKLIIVDFGITELTAQVDLYSDWKEWMAISDNSKYLQALRTVAGDPTKPGQLISPYYFLMNGWLIRPHEADHELSIDGNLYGEVTLGVPQDLITPTLGAYTVLVNIDRSVNAVTIEVAGGTADWTDPEKAQIRDSLGVDGAKTAAAGGQLQTLSADVAAIEVRLILMQQLATNRLELTDGNPGVWTLYGDDDLTPILVFPVTGPAAFSGAIVQPEGFPSRRGRGVAP